MDERFALRLTDKVLVAAIKAAAEQQQTPIGQWASDALRRALVSSGACVRCEERQEKWRARYRAQRAAAGKPVRAARVVPFRKSGVLAERICPLCDTVFTPPIRAQHQKYCNELCTRYVFTYGQDIAKARVAYAAFMVRRQHGSKR